MPLLNNKEKLRFKRSSISMIFINWGNRTINIYLQSTYICMSMPLSWYPIHSIVTNKTKQNEPKWKIWYYYGFMQHRKQWREQKTSTNWNVFWTSNCFGWLRLWVLNIFSFILTNLIFGLFSLLVHCTDTSLLHSFKLTYQTLKIKNKTKNWIEWISAKFSVLQCYLIWSNVIEFFTFEYKTKHTQIKEATEKKLNEILLESGKKTQRCKRYIKWAKAKPNWCWVGFELQFRLGLYFIAQFVFVWNKAKRNEMNRKAIKITE